MDSGRHTPGLKTAQQAPPVRLWAITVCDSDVISAGCASTRRRQRLFHLLAEANYGLRLLKTSGDRRRTPGPSTRLRTIEVPLGAQSQGCERHESRVRHPTPNPQIAASIHPQRDLKIGEYGPGQVSGDCEYPYPSPCVSRGYLLAPLTLGFLPYLVQS